MISKTAEIILMVILAIIITALIMSPFFFEFF